MYTKHGKRDIEYSMPFKTVTSILNHDGVVLAQLEVVPARNITMEISNFGTQI